MKRDERTTTTNGKRFMKMNSVEVNTQRNGQWLRRLGLRAALVLGLVLAGVAFNSLLPKVPLKGSGTHTRAGWYLSSGQWRADARTLASAVEYVVTSDPKQATEASVAVRGRSVETVQSPIDASVGIRRNAW